MSNFKKLYLIGHPVAHSKSPAMHNALYRALGLDWQYELKDCESEDEAREFITQGDFCGLNVTTPYKRIPLECAQKVDVFAQLAGGANVVVRGSTGVSESADDCGCVNGGASEIARENSCDGSHMSEHVLSAYNVDGLGCVRYLQRHGIDFSRQRVVVCGSGPTSISIMQAVISAGAPKIVLLGRNAEHTQNVLQCWREKLFRLIGEYSGRSEAGARGKRIFVGMPSAQRCGEFGGAAEVFGTDFIAAEIFGTDLTKLSGGDVSASCYASSSQAIKDATLIINATPLGMNAGDPAPFDTSLLTRDTCVFDAVYGHGETELACGARKAHCEYLDGLGMLVAQAVLSAQIFLHAHNVETTSANLDFDDAFKIMSDAVI